MIGDNTYPHNHVDKWSPHSHSHVRGTILIHSVIMSVDKYTGGGDNFMWITPLLAWGHTPPSVGVSPLPSLSECQLGGIIPYVTQKNFWEKFVLFWVFITKVKYEAYIE